MEIILPLYGLKHIIVAFYPGSSVVQYFGRKSKTFVIHLCWECDPLFPQKNLYIWQSFSKNFSLHTFKIDVWNWQLNLPVLLSLVGFTV